MAYNVIMPQMGESIAEGTITKWLKNIGDRVKQDEPLFEISTDKVDAEIPSPTTGVLKEIKAQPGTTVPINSVVAVIETSGAVSVAAEPSAPAPALQPTNTMAAHGVPETPKTTVPVPQTPPLKASPPLSAPIQTAKPTPAPALQGNVMSLEERRQQKSSPVVRKIAAEHGLDVSQISGTGISGRVTRQDIESFIAQGNHSQQPSFEQSAAIAMPVATISAAQPQLQTQSLPQPASATPDAFKPKILDGDRIESLSVMRAKIAEHMVWSRRISPHVCSIFEVDYTHVSKVLQKYKSVWQERHGVKLTFTTFIMKALVDALKVHPLLNASLDGQKVIYHRAVNLGMAVALDWGLIVPVIHHADELNLLGLARRAIDLAERARSKKLKPEEVQEGTFTITNPGIFGNLFGLPIINQPQAAIVSVGTIEKRPVVIDDMIAIRTMGCLSIAFDHRLIDGAVADQFMALVKKSLQEFDESGF